MRELTIEEIKQRIWTAVYSNFHDHALFWLLVLEKKERELAA